MRYALRVYASVVTYIALALLVFCHMWFRTNCDVLEIIVVNIVFTPYIGLVVMAVTEEPDDEDLEAIELIDEPLKESRIRSYITGKIVPFLHIKHDKDATEETTDEERRAAS